MVVASGVSPERLVTFEEQAKTAILRDAVNFPLPRFLGKFDVPDLGEAFRAPVETSAPVLVLTGTLDGRTYPEGHREILYRSEEHTSELQSLMRTSYAVFCLKKKN